MPLVDGPQVFQMLRQEPVTQHISVVFPTGVGTREGRGARDGAEVGRLYPEVHHEGEAAGLFAGKDMTIVESERENR